MPIRSEWFLRRYTAIDTAIRKYEFFKGETSLGATFLKSERAFDHVGRRINWAQRNFQFAPEPAPMTRGIATSTLNWSLAKLTLPPIYPILDTATLARLNFPVLIAAEAMLEGGARILQLRHKGFWSRETFALAETLNALCKSAGVLFVVNDRADYAAALGTALHVGQDDLTPADARRVLGRAIGAEAILGYSTHNPDQVRFAEQQTSGAIDYLAFGPMFTTVSKERPDPTVGIAGLKAIRALTQKPLVAIGGITRDNAFTCLNAGANSVAVIADLYPTTCTKTTLRDRMTEWQTLTAA